MQNLDVMWTKIIDQLPLDTFRHYEENYASMKIISKPTQLSMGLYKIIFLDNAYSLPELSIHDYLNK